MSLGEPFGSMFAVLPTICLAALATLLGTVCGIGAFLPWTLRSGKRKVLAGIGIVLSLASPLLLWAAVVLCP
jgi:hypothetical protein